MTNQELAELINRKFAEVDARLTGVDGRLTSVDARLTDVDARLTDVDGRLANTATREELRAASEETRRHFGVVAERLEGQIRLVAEGILNIDEKLERFRQEVRGEFQEVRAMIKFSYAELDRRVSVLEDALASLRGRVERLEDRLP